MVLLNLQFQLDTPKGLVNVHAFVQDTVNAEGTDCYAVYCNVNNRATRIEEPNFHLAMEAVRVILKACEKEYDESKE